MIDSGSPADCFYTECFYMFLALPSFLATLPLRAGETFRARYIPSSGKSVNFRLNHPRIRPQRGTFARPVTATRENERNIG
jgi:hypothetical protein